MEVYLIKAPTDDDWAEALRRARVTMGKNPLEKPKPPSHEWRRKILRARHSPIRYLMYSFAFVDIPANIAVHLSRHKHAEPYNGSLRNDRQDRMDGDKASRDTPINLIYDCNAEELMTLANKRECNQAAQKTREAVGKMCRLAEAATPELVGLLVPNCVWHGGYCYEMKPCGKPGIITLDEVWESVKKTIEESK